MNSCVRSIVPIKAHDISHTLCPVYRNAPTCNATCVSSIYSTHIHQLLAPLNDLQNILDVAPDEQLCHITNDLNNILDVAQ